MIRLLILMICLSGPLRAVAETWPALVDVTGVQRNDVLNVRAEPGTQAPVIGFLRPDARNIEVVSSDAGGRWALINLEGQTGWISRRFVQRRPGQDDGMAPEISQCFGTEPFWTLGGMKTNTPHWRTPEGETAVALSATTPSANRRDRFAVSGAFGDTKDRLAGIMRPAACNDGMSDRAYGLQIDLLVTDSNGGSPRLFSGCCSLLP